MVTCDGVTTNYALDTAIGLAEVIFTSAGHSYLHLPGLIMTESAGGATRYLLADGLGSIRHVTDEAGIVVGSQEFDPYGNPLAEPETAYGFTGEWWSADVGLLHLRARWYDPASGTFLSKDPWEGDERRPLTMNGWSYVEGNPINRIDPTGLCGADDNPGEPPSQATKDCIHLANILEKNYGLTIYWPPDHPDPCDNYSPAPDPTLANTYKQWTRNELTSVALGVLLYKNEIGERPVRMVLDGVTFVRLEGEYARSEYFSDWSRYTEGFEGKPVIGFSDQIHEGAYLTESLWFGTWTSAHEIAHRIHHFLQSNNIKNLDNDFSSISTQGVTRYGHLNGPREDIAESITVYLWERHQSNWKAENILGFELDLLWDPILWWSWTDNLDQQRTQFVEDVFDALKNASK